MKAKIFSFSPKYKQRVKEQGKDVFFLNLRSKTSKGNSLDCNTIFPMSMMQVDVKQRSPQKCKEKMES